MQPPHSETPARPRQSLIDADLKVTGQVLYALNVDLPGMTYARCVRSPYAHARILSIETARAEALPGVLAVLTREDLKDERLFPYYGAALKDQPIVAIDKARHVGDVVAAVVRSEEHTSELQSQSNLVCRL